MVSLVPAPPAHSQDMVCAAESLLMTHPDVEQGLGTWVVVMKDFANLRHRPSDAWWAGLMAEVQRNVDEANALEAAAARVLADGSSSGGSSNSGSSLQPGAEAAGVQPHVYKLIGPDAVLVLGLSYVRLRAQLGPPLLGGDDDGPASRAWSAYLASAVPDAFLSSPSMDLVLGLASLAVSLGLPMPADVCAGVAQMTAGMAEDMSTSMVTVCLELFMLSRYTPEGEGQAEWFTLAHQDWLAGLEEQCDPQVGVVGLGFRA